jgi:hypothetical protein
MRSLYKVISERRLMNCKFFIPIEHVVVNELRIRCPEVEVKDVLEVRASEGTTLVITWMVR